MSAFGTIFWILGGFRNNLLESQAANWKPEARRNLIFNLLLKKRAKHCKNISNHAKSTDLIFRTLDKNIHLVTLPLRRFPHLYSTCKVVGDTRVIYQIFFSHYFSVPNVPPTQCHAVSVVGYILSPVSCHIIGCSLTTLESSPGFLCSLLSRFPAISTHFMSWFLIGYKTSRVLWCHLICCLSTTPASSHGFLCSFLSKIYPFTSTFCHAFTLVVYIVSRSFIGLYVELSSLYPYIISAGRLPNYALLQHTSDKLIIIIM